MKANTKKFSTLEIMAIFLIIVSVSLTFSSAGTEEATTHSGEAPSEAACNLPLGITAGKFAMEKFKTLSVHSFETYPSEAGLNSPGGYRAKQSDNIADKFVAVEFDNETVVTGVAIQGFGDPDIQEWVTQYSVKFTRQKSGEEPVIGYISDSDGRPKLFQGNNDSDTIVRNNFAAENVKQVFIEPQAAHENVAFRFELYGCIMKRSVVLYFRWTNQTCSLEMLIDKKSDGFKNIEAKLADEVRQLSILPGVQVVKLERLRPGSLIVEFKVGVQDSQVETMIAGAKKLLKSSSKFDHNYFAVKDPQGTPFCKTPNISLPSLSHSPYSAIKIKRSSPYTVKAFISSQTQGRVYVTWKFSKLRHSNKENLGRKSTFKSAMIATEEVDLKHTTAIEKEILNRTLEYGLYYIELMVVMKNATDCLNYNYGFLRITESPLQVVMSTNPALESILKGYHKYLELDASNSFDPDVQKANKSDLKYTWLCSRKGENFGNTVLLPVVIPHENEDEPDVGGCYGNGPGKLNYTGPNAVLFLDKMKPKNSYVIQLILEKGKRKKNASYEFVLKTSHDFDLEIRCKRKCKEKVNPKERIIFEGVCLGEVCRQTNTKYRWSLYQKRDDGTFQSVEIGNNEELTLLEIDANVLEESKEYQLQLHGNLTEKIRTFQTHKFITNRSPSGGDCTVDKLEGKVLVTNFTFTCFDWVDDDSDLVYQFGYSSSTGAYEILQESTQRYLRTNKLPLGDSKKENIVQVDIYVKDKWGGFDKRSVKVKVLSSKSINATTLYQYTVGNDSEIAKMLKNKDGGKQAMRLANTLLSVMSATPDKELKKEDKIKFKDEMIKHSSKVKVDDLQGLILVTSVVASATDKSEELSEESQWTSVDVLENMANKFQNLSGGINEKDPNGMKKAGNNLLLGIGNVLDASVVKPEVQEQDKTEDEEKVEENKVNATKTKVLAKKAWILITKVGDSMLSSQEVGDEPLEMETKAISMRLNRQLPSAISEKPATINDSKVTFPPPEELLGSKAMDMKHVDTQMLSLKNNPFSWDKSAKTVKSAVISIDLKDEKGEILNVSGLAQEIELNIKTDRPQEDQAPLHSFIKPSVNGSMRYHSVKISSEEMVLNVKIVPSNGTKLQVYFRYLKRPTVTNFDFVAQVPEFSSCKKRAKQVKEDSHPVVNDGYFNCTKDPYLLTLSSNVTGHIGLHFIGIRFPNSNEDVVKTKRKRRSCSESGRQKRSEICVEFKDPPTTPPPTPRLEVPAFDPNTDVNYTLSISMGACLYWSESKEKWTSEGCRVGPNSANGTIQCLCTHLSAFGGDFLVAPNPIDFDQVWDAFSNILETGNFVVLATVCAMLGLYLIAVVFARRADRSDKQKVTQVIPLGDVNTDNHCYELSIYTGIWRRCGTSANVAIMIYGDDRDTDVIPLNCSTMCNKKLFARGSVNTFMLSLKESLGDLSHIKIWHDNTGDNPQWYVNKIVIRDPKTDTTWFFVCNRWLAAEREDGKIERVLYVSSPSEINSFRNKFYSRAAAGLGDGHIWLSVVTRPPTSPFTRVQRVSCCLSVLMSAMVTNAMFYQFDAEDTSNSFQLGPLVLSWRQIIIGIQSAVLVVPINVLIVFIFRNSKPKEEVTQAYSTNSDSLTQEPTRKSGCSLPPFFVYVGWALCIMVSLTSAAFTVFYSMMWGTEVSNKWLTSILVSFTQDVLFIQPIKVVIVASLLALIIKKAPEDDSVKQQLKSVAHSKVKGESYNPRTPDKQQLERFRQYRLRVLIMARVLIELAFYLVFAWALMVICYGRRDTEHYWMTNGIDELLPKFEKIHNADSFWAWTKKYLVPAMYEVNWYNGKAFKYKDGFISDMSGYLVGMPRFRQLRVKPGPCPITSHFPEFIATLHPCLPPYSITNEDQTRFSMPKWREVSANETALLSEFALREMCPRPWRYKEADELHNLPLQGLRALYGGGGFVADLGYTKSSALRVIQNLQNNSWIDERTRAVFIEFMIFDSSTNLFSAASYVFESLPLGGATTFKTINTMSLYGARSSGTRSVSAICELIVLLMVFYFIVSEAIKIWKEKCKYFKSAWSYVEIAQILAATAMVVLSIFRRYHTTKLVNRIHANPFETSSFHYVVLWSDLENVLMAILVFILTVKVLKILKFNQHISSLAASMGRCRDKIISYSAVFMVAFLAFMQIALLVFGTTTKAYSSVSQVFRTQFGMFIGGETNYHELKDANRIIGPIYFFLFMTAMACILINMFLAILNESYREVRIYPDRDTEEYKMLGVFMDYAKNAMGKKFTSLRNAKFFPKRESYSVKNEQAKSKKDLEDDHKYTPVNWSTYDSIYQKDPENSDLAIERSFFKDIRRHLRNISDELKEISLVNRTGKYKVHEVQKQFEIEIDEPFKDLDLRTPCKGLGLEKVSSKCSLFSLSESTMYLDRRKGRDSIRRLLGNDDTSDVEDIECDDGTSYAESMRTFFGNSGSIYDPEREPFSESDAWSLDRESYI